MWVVFDDAYSTCAAHARNINNNSRKDSSENAPSRWRNSPVFFCGSYEKKPGSVSRTSMFTALGRENKSFARLKSRKRNPPDDCLPQEKTNTSYQGCPDACVNEKQAMWAMLSKLNISFVPLLRSRHGSVGWRTCKSTDNKTWAIKTGRGAC